MELLTQYTFAARPLEDWVMALGLSMVGILAVLFLVPVLIRRLESLATHTRTRIDDALLAAIRATRVWLFVIIALGMALQILTPPERIARLLDAAATLALFVQVGLWAMALLSFWFSRTRAKALQSNASAATSLSALGFIAELVLWTVIALLALDNLGVNITALVAGLGVGGIAVALAVQNILGDLFASLSIVIDKPFVIGDFIVVDDYMGTVENVGLKTTRVRSLQGELIVFSNSDLLKTRVRNYQHLHERRVVFTFGVAHETSVEQVRALLAATRRIVETQPKVRYDRAHFTKFGESSLDFEVVYWVTDPNYNLSMDIQQNINLLLKETMEAERIVLAYPTRILRVAEPLPLTGERDSGKARVLPGDPATTAGTVKGGARRQPAAAH